MQSPAELIIALGTIVSLAFLKEVETTGVSFAGGHGIATYPLELLHPRGIRLIDRGVIPIPCIIEGWTNLFQLGIDGLKLFELFRVLCALIPDAFRAGDKAIADCR